eukprot:CAMPEP_0183311730 /NCGR_PEP_ID=MMETSP0160_2-20130417/38579_1 /TAXON_ID=2839 ORGANISM="Odontella Sinensis, Strain Grunow 1884" /NCGR_SAMPLE_ID=MMETSP0160_2 /ASSEMBLY_ACC=CAM_ASM_000250 /LENGTH=128 /DNA_ID=CAMNT_0025476403 /DNA_START=78 /DNA_END=461 /DNA_ORIENTATION=-
MVKAGDFAPDFELRDVDGKRCTLSQFRGKKIMLSFYRYASCPLCRYAIDQLKGRYKKLAWAAKLKVITVFPSPSPNIRKYVLKGTTSSNFPFVALSDPEEEAYKKYQVGASMWGLIYGSSRSIITGKW